VPVGLLLSLIAVNILIYTGWKGGEMVFRTALAFTTTALKLEGRIIAAFPRAAYLGFVPALPLAVPV
jgi:hypothetical protein